MKKSLFTIITDLHISDNNYQTVQDNVIQAIDYTQKLGHNIMIVAGDIFNSRKYQSLIVLKSWMHILDYCQSKKIQLLCIPGNHDKLDYTSEHSYLDIFEQHPNCTVISHCDDYDIEEGTRIHLIPYFDEKSTYQNYLSKVNYLDNGVNYLITHVAINGVMNNDGSKVQDILSAQLFKDFDKVFVGHYHNRQTIGDNIIYIGSLIQNNYGEDDRKGITVVYTDKTHQIFPLQAPSFETVDIDLDQVSNDQLKKLCLAYKDKAVDNNVRFKFTGSKEKVEALDKTIFDAVNIDVKCKYKDIEVDVSYQQALQFSAFNKQSIITEWDSFADEHQIDKIQGKQQLQKIL